MARRHRTNNNIFYKNEETMTFLDFATKQAHSYSVLERRSKPVMKMTQTPRTSIKDAAFWVIKRRLM